MKHFSKSKFAVTVASLLLLSSCNSATDNMAKVQNAVDKAPGAIAAFTASKDNLINLKDGVSQTLTAVKAGDFSKAQQEFGKVQENWKGVEANLKTISADGSKNVQEGLQTVSTELQAQSPDKEKLTASLQGLTKSLSGFAVGGGAMPGADAAFQSNLTAMQEALAKTTTAVESSDFAGAKETFGTARQTWFKFGGSVKQQSAETYQKLDDGVKDVHTAVNTAEPQKDVLLSNLKALSTDLESVSTQK